MKICTNLRNSFFFTQKIPTFFFLIYKNAYMGSQRFLLPPPPPPPTHPFSKHTHTHTHTTLPCGGHMISWGAPLITCKHVDWYRPVLLNLGEIINNQQDMYMPGRQTGTRSTWEYHGIHLFQWWALSYDSFALVVWLKIHCNSVTTAWSMNYIMCAHEI